MAANDISNDISMGIENDIWKQAVLKKPKNWTNESMLELGKEEGMRESPNHN